MSYDDLQKRIFDCRNIQDGALCDNKVNKIIKRLPAVNFYHKALHLGCCSSPRSAFDFFCEKLFFGSAGTPWMHLCINVLLQSQNKLNAIILRESWRKKWARSNKTNIINKMVSLDWNYQEFNSFEIENRKIRFGVKRKSTN